MTLNSTPYATLRPDLQAVADLIPPGVKALDLGCGDGALLAYLVQHKQVRGRGIELSEPGVMACMDRGLSVRQGDLEEGLADYPTASFDVVILSQTLPFLDDPAVILHEMLRVGRSAVISLPNWGYWRCRLELLLTGRVPQAPDLPQPWYAAPRWQAVSITDFAQFCGRVDIAITAEIYLNRGRRVRIIKVKNLLAMTAVFRLEPQRQPNPM